MPKDTGYEYPEGEFRNERTSSSAVRTSENTNEQIKDTASKKVHGSDDNTMRKIKIGGEASVRSEVDKQGRTKFRNEITGTYAKEDAFDTSEVRMAGLAKSIKQGKTMGAMDESTNALGFGTAKASSTMSKNIGDNAGSLQKIFEKEGDETQEELKKLVDMMTKAQSLTGEKATEARAEISKQTARLQIKAGDSSEQMTKMLGLDQVKKDLGSGSKLKEALNIDQSATGFKAVKQAFSPSRLFGDAGTGGLSGGGGMMSTMASKLLGTGDVDSFQAKKARMEIAQEDQGGGLLAAVGDDGLRLAGDPDKVSDDDTKSKDNTVAESTAAAVDDDKPRESMIGQGQDSESWGEKQHETLEKILSKLDEIAENGGMGGDGNNVAAKKTTKKTKAKATKTAKPAKIASKVSSTAKNVATQGAKSTAAQGAKTVAQQGATQGAKTVATQGAKSVGSTVAQGAKAGGSLLKGTDSVLLQNSAVPLSVSAWEHTKQ